MPVYKLQGPDGKVYSIEGPEGATAEQLGAFVSAQDPKTQRLAKFKEENDKFIAGLNPTDGMSTYEKVMAGAGKAVSDTGQGIGQLLGLTSRADVEETRKRDAALMDTGAGMAGNIGGNVAMVLAPGGAMAGAGKLLSKVPQAAKYAEALMAGGKAMMAPKSIPQALGIGAAQGFIQPSTSTGETLLNTGIGAAASAAVPVAIRGGQVAKAALDPFSEAGQQRIMSRALNAAAGGEAGTMRKNISDVTAPFVGPTPEGQTARTMMGEVVPGSIPTTGQAAGVPSIAALERTALAGDPTAGNLMAQRLAQQNQARVGTVEGVAGTGGKREFFEANRKATADDLYAQARKQGIDAAALTPEAQANIASFQQRVPDEIMARAREIAKINGVNMDNESSVQGMHWVKKAIDSKISTAVSSGDKEMASAYTGLQHSLLDGMDQMSPLYGEARRTFSAMSKPINEMQVAQAVADHSINPLTGNLQPQAYARALSDKTAASTTGMKNATLENTMSTQGLNALERVQEDLARANFANTAGKGVGSDTFQKLAYSNLMEQSGLPKMVGAIPGMGSLGGIVQRVADAGYGRANKEMSSKLAQALLNPQDAASMLEAGVVSPQMQMLVDSLRRGGAGMGAATPALLNAQKQ